MFARLLQEHNTDLTNSCKVNANEESEHGVVSLQKRKIVFFKTKQDLV